MLAKWTRLADVPFQVEIGVKTSAVDATARHLSHFISTIKSMFRVRFISRKQRRKVPTDFRNRKRLCHRDMATIPEVANSLWKFLRGPRRSGPQFPAFRGPSTSRKDSFSVAMLVSINSSVINSTGALKETARFTSCRARAGTGKPSPPSPGR